MDNNYKKIKFIIYIYIYKINFILYIYIYFCFHDILCYNHCNYFNNFLPSIKFSARASVIPCLARLKIVR